MFFAKKRLTRAEACHIITQCDDGRKCFACPGETFFKTAGNPVVSNKFVLRSNPGTDHSDEDLETVWRYTMKTFMANPAEVDRKWYVVDAEGQTLGRLASEVAKVLRGKNKPVFTPHVDTGDYVIVVNA